MQPHDIISRSILNLICSDSGAVWLFALQSDGSVLPGSLKELTTPGLVLRDDDHFGASIAAPGDVDGDGVVDVVVGAPQIESCVAGAAGGVFVFFLTASRDVDYHVRFGGDLR
jgi:hypothetical protein